MFHVSVSWSIAVQPAFRPKGIDNLSEKEQAVEYAKVVQKEYFKGGDWAFEVTIGDSVYWVDTETFTATPVKEIDNYVRSI